MLDIQTTREWKCFEDDETGGAIRQFPSGRSYHVEDHIGLLAIAEGAAIPLGDLTEQQTLELEVIKASIAGDEVKVAALLEAADRSEAASSANAAATASAVAAGGTGVVS